MRRNLIAVVILNSGASFCNYLLGYYTKYFPGIFFVNYALIGLADCFTTAHAQLLSKYLTKTTTVISFILI